MISLDAPFLWKRVDILLLGQFGAEANPHPDNARTAKLGQSLVAAQLERDGHQALATAVRANLNLD